MKARRVYRSINALVLLAVVTGRLELGQVVRPGRRCSGKGGRR